MLKNFSIYTLIGILNTGLHYVVFYALYVNSLNQSYSNLIAFLLSATFSFFMNAKFNFKYRVNKKKYFLFVFG